MIQLIEKVSTEKLGGYTMLHYSDPFGKYLVIDISKIGKKEGYLILKKYIMQHPEILYLYKNKLN